MDKPKLSVALAVYNEEENISQCLESVKGLADEIVVVDGSSTDRTIEIAKSFGAKITVTGNPAIFHINKQMAFDLAGGDWILSLDADERVTKKLGEEILKVIRMSDEEIEEYQKTLKKKRLFLRHQQLLEKRDGKIGTSAGGYAAFFFPRLNFFLGKFLKFGGVYPDGVIRLFKKDKAHLPSKDVHEQMTVDGRVGWLENDLIHIDSKTFGRYLQRNSRYIDLLAADLRKQHLKINLTSSVDYFLIKPLLWFLTTSLRNKGILDGYQGLVFSFFSALRFPRAYWRYINNK